MEHRQQIPNSSAALTLGICSIVFSCCGVGLILGIIGIVLATKGKNLYKQNPEMYEGSGVVTAGFVTSIIGTSFGAMWVFFFIIRLIITGMVFSYSNIFNQ